MMIETAQPPHPYPSPPKGRGREGGFTLIELLVAMTLIAILSLALVSALRAMGQTGERVDQSLLRSDDMRTTVSFLRSVLARVSVRKLDVLPLQQGASPFQMQATPDSLVWLGIMPARYGAGGRTYFKLALEPSNVGQNAGQALTLRYVPWSGVNALPEWGSAESRVLVDRVTQLRFQYEDNRYSGWLDAWVEPTRLPERVSLDLEVAKKAWPTVILPMRGLFASSSATGGFVIGGTVE